jgi:uncharacterized protein
MNPGRMIDYESLAQEAMRGVVRTILARVAKSGLPGDHHFYVSFDTQAPGAHVSKRLKDKYPEEMTIVLQHRFWDLAVHEDRFEVKLTFDGIPERLVVPFAALKVFFDPSVRYGMQFEGAEPLPDATPDTQMGRKERAFSSPGNLSGVAVPSPLGPQVRSGSSRSTGERKTRAARSKTVVDKPAPEPPRANERPTPDFPAEPPASHNDQAAAREQQRVGSNGGAEIVRLDAFRKK